MSVVDMWEEVRNHIVTTSLNVFTILHREYCRFSFQRHKPHPC